jgi:hypothetical protein
VVWGGKKPNLIPGARTFDNESKRTTLPSVSRLKNEGIKLFKSSSPVIKVDFILSSPAGYSSICRKSKSDYFSERGNTIRIILND